MTALATEMSGISKRFGSVVALENVELRVPQNKIHALVGENGAGKTTLMRILYGAIKQDGGNIQVFDQNVEFHSAKDGIAHNIGMVSQHYSIIPELTCLQNLMLGAEPGVLLDEKSSQNRAQELAEQMQFTFDWRAPASTLSPASAQKLEILKLLWRRSKLLILDEPTAMLSPADADSLYASLKKLVNDGATVIVVTHRLPEVLDHCDSVTVLRGGKKISDHLVSDVNSHMLAELIVGHSMEATSLRTQERSQEVILDINALSVLGVRRDEAVKQLDLKLMAGEMVGIAGVDGSGQRELFQCLFGLLPAWKGTVSFHGEDVVQESTPNRIEKGMRIVPEDRHEEGVIDDWSLIENGALGLQRLHPLKKKTRAVHGEKRELAKRVAELFSTKHGGLDQPMRSLSGGNQQRFVAARALQLNPKLILAFQPSRGLDIDGSRQVFEKIRDACRSGAAALIVSFDLDELIGECDRVVAMNLGRLLTPPKGSELDRAEIGRLMVGAV